MTTFIDRRQDGKNKSAVNRQKFIRRFKGQIKKAVTDSMSGRNITDVDNGERVNIPKKDLEEPTFSHDPRKGVRETIHPGNREFVPGDKIARPSGGNRGGSGGGRASNRGEGEDDFIFVLSPEEFSALLFDGLELPNLKKKQCAETVEFKSVRAGFSRVGPSTQIHIVRTLKGSIARRIALSGPHKKRIAEIETELEKLRARGVSEVDQSILDLLKEREREKGRIRALPFIDTFDLRYANHVPQPQPTIRAVVFFILDVSGSMGEKEKDLAKRFFLLLYLFLKRNYKKVEVVFIRHHTTAKEVNEEEFFHGRETGGTVVSTALELMADIQRKRFPVSNWNIYGAQATDGDDFADDPLKCRDLLLREIMPTVQYFSYLETLPVRHQSLWERYEEVGAQYKGSFAMRTVREPDEVYPAFCEIFKKRAH